MEKFKHKKSLGQNFLHDSSILRRIKNSISAEENDLIIEIGPGEGALTKYLQEFSCNVVCFEIDERLCDRLNKIKNEKTEIVFQDFLTVDIARFINSYDYNKLYIVANLPYYITTPIITKIIESLIDVEEMILMVQLEVANRFTAKPGRSDYGSITVYFNYYYDVDKLFEVNRQCFTPVPNVDSAVIRFKKKQTRYEVNNEQAFFKLVRDAFTFKRKTLRNNLRSYNLDKIAEVLDRYGLDLSARAEQLGIEVFVAISNEL